MEGLARRTIWNISSNYARTVLLVLIALLLNPFLFHRLGADGYGVIALTGTTAGLLGLLDLGLAHAVARFVSRYHTLNLPGRVNQVIQTSLIAYLVAGLVAASIVGAAGMFLVDSLGVPEVLHGEARWLLLLAGLSLAIRFPGNALDGALRGLQRFELSNLAQVADRITYAVLAVMVLAMLGLGLVAIGYCMIAASFVAVSVRCLALVKVYRGLSFGVGGASWKSLGEMTSFGAMAFLTQVSSFIEQTVFRLVISATLGSTLLGAYSLVMVVVSVLPQLTIGATSVVMPLASSLDALDDQRRLRRLLLDGSRFVFLLLTPVAAWIIVMAEAITMIWVGPDLAPWSRLLSLMALVTAFDFCCGAGNMVLMGAGRARLLGTTYLISSLVAVMVLVILLQATEAGLYSAVGALGAGVAIRRSIVLVRMCRSVGISVMDYLRGALGPALLCGLVTAGALVFSRRWFTEYGWLELMMTVGIAVGTHVVAGILFVVRKEERAIVRSWLMRRFSASSAPHN